MKKTWIWPLAICSMMAALDAQATSISYSHKYEDVSKSHTDEISVSHHFSAGPKLSAALKFEPHDEDSGDAGIAFHDDRWHETKLKVSYPLAAAERLTVEPGFSWARKQDSYKYKPFIKFKYKIVKALTLTSRYRYEIADYAYKETRKKHRIDIGVNTEFRQMDIDYKYSYYHGDSVLFNRSHHDYEQSITFAYPVTHALAPYLQLTNESVSKSNDRRQTEFEVGLKYKF
ncbi:MAG: oligogalacturonate-specific porin KdgM family protein [Vibrio sp.]